MIQSTVAACCTIFLSLGLLSGCPAGPCVDEGLETGKSYRVTFLELYNEDSTLAAWDSEIVSGDSRECPGTLPPMANFDATAISEDRQHYEGSCTSSVLELDETSWGSVVNNETGRPGDGFTHYSPLAFWAANVEDAQGCRASTNLYLVAPAEGSPFAALNPSEAPPLLAIRSVNPENSEACESYPETGCFERWLVRLEEVN
jgi:hypothetical protein